MQGDSLSYAITATRDGATAWYAFVEHLRTRGYDGPSDADPYWRAIGLPEGPYRGRLWLKEERASITDRFPGPDTITITLGLLSGGTLALRASTAEPIRALRLAAADNLGVCVGQVQLLMEIPVSGHAPLAPLERRLAEHLGCSPRRIRSTAGTRRFTTLALTDGLTLRD